jgi:hypothetical protein
MHIYTERLDLPDNIDPLIISKLQKQSALTVQLAIVVSHTQ